MPNNVVNIAEEIIDVNVTEQYVVVNAMNGPGPTGPAGPGGLVNPMITVGDMITGGSAGVPTRVAGNTTATKLYLTQTGDGTNSAAPVWAQITGTEVIGAALTKTDDQNVTLTLGGSATTALLRAASLTVGWSGQLAVTRGGTGTSSLDGIVVGNNTSAFTAITGTASQLLRRNAGNSAYEFFTPTYISGNQTITLSGDVTGSGATAITTTITNNSVTLAKLATVATSTFLGRATAGAGNVEALTSTQATGLLELFTSTTKGLTPQSGGGTTNFLRADGTWAAPIGSVTSVAVAAGTSGTDVNISGSPITSSGTITVNIPDAGASARGLVTTVAQTFAGAKTFSSTLVCNDTIKSTSGTIDNILSYGGGGGIIGTISNHPLAIRANNTAAIYIQTNQNVGIGTSTDGGYKLDVVGVIRGQSGVAVYNSVSGFGTRMTQEAIGGTETFKIAKDGALTGPFAYHFYYSDGSSAFNIRNGTSILQDDSWETIYISGSSTKRNLSVGSSYFFSFFDAGASRYGAIGSIKTDNNNSALILRYRASGTDTEGVRLLNTGQLKFNAYTSSTSFSGTAAGYLAFDSSGNIITSSGSGGGSGTPAGSSGQIQFNSSGAFGADSNFVWDNTAKAFGVGATTVNSKAVMELTSTTKGFLPPRMTSTQRAAITSPVEGLVVFQTDTVSTSNSQGLWIYVNATWRSLTMR